MTDLERKYLPGEFGLVQCPLRKPICDFCLLTFVFCDFKVLSFEFLLLSSE